MKEDIFTSSDTHFYNGSEKIHLFDTFYAEIWQTQENIYSVHIYTELTGIKRFKRIGLDKPALSKETAYELVEWAKNNKEWFENWLKYTLERITEETDYESNKARLMFKQYFKEKES